MNYQLSAIAQTVAAAQVMELVLHKNNEQKKAALVQLGQIKGDEVTAELKKIDPSLAEVHDKIHNFSSTANILKQEVHDGRLKIKSTPEELQTTRTLFPQVKSSDCLKLLRDYVISYSLISKLMPNVSINQLVYSINVQGKEPDAGINDYDWIKTHKKLVAELEVKEEKEITLPQLPAGLAERLPEYALRGREGSIGLRDLINQQAVY